VIWQIAVEIKKILQLGKNYPWPKPETCPRCGAKGVWGHGFVWAYFDEALDGLWLRRYRCPHCRCMIRLKPCGYFPRFQAFLKTVRSRLHDRLATGRWGPGLSKSRQRHWLLALRRKTAAWFDNTFQENLIAAFDRLISLGQIPVSRSI